MACFVLVAIVIIVIAVSVAKARPAKQRRLQPSYGAVIPSGVAVTNNPAIWIERGAAVTVAGRSVAGGMCYVGHGSRAANGYSVEPSLIDQTLKVDWTRPDWSGGSMGYWPAYDRIPPECRAAFLSWVSSDRSDPSTYIGYVFLYFYGLERRVLLDAKLNAAHPDVPLIAMEVERLLSIYGSNGSFRRYGSDFLSLVESLSLASGELTHPNTSWVSKSWEVPLAVRVALGRYVAAGQPIPADWALALLRTHPEIHLRTPAVRCAEDFDELFLQRYSRKFGGGMIVKPPKATIHAAYHPASAGFGGVVQLRLGALPDITKLVGPANKLRDIADECCDALDAYSRHLGKKPEAASSVVAIGLLPDELFIKHAGDSLTELRSWLGQLLASDPHPEVLLDELVEHWAPGAPPKISRAGAISLTTLLSKLDVGMEPDVRFGAVTPQPGSGIVLFEQRVGAPSSPSPEYATASVLVQLCAVVAGADGSAGDAERVRLAAQLETAFHLSEFERDRLNARLTWLVGTKAGLGGVKKRVETVPSSGRTAIGNLLVDIAAADGVVSPAEISALAKVFTVLGLDEGAAYSRIHALETDDIGPVTVRTADASAQRWSIPAPESGHPVVLHLDPDKVKERLAATEEVAALLSGIFSEDDTEPPAPADEPEDVREGDLDAGIPVFPGLDKSHSRLLELLRGRPSWARTEAEGVAASVGLPLLAGALDRINEAIIESCGEPLLEGDDPLRVNQYALEELF